MIVLCVSVNFYVSTWTQDVTTSARMLIDSLKSCFKDMRDLLTDKVEAAKL